MMKSILLVLLVGAFASASTFVGNGGNAGDLELQVTFSQIRKSLNEIAQKNFNSAELCRCNESMEGHKICKALKVLNSAQKDFCAATLVTQANPILDLIGRAQLVGQDPVSQVQILWTTEAMQVNEKAGMRDAQAVAVPQEKKILLDKKQFLDLNDYERIYLLTHELGHLVPIEKQYLRDDQKVGPFAQNDGGRQLLNSLGAAVAMKSLTNGGIDDYKGSLRRSKNYKQNWLSLSITADTAHNDESTFAIKNYTGFQTSYRYQLSDQWGISASYRAKYGDATILQSVKVNSNLSLMNAQIHYRLFPFSDPLSFWGQSHFVLGAGYESGHVNYTLDDGFTSAEDTANFSSPIISAEYFIPLYVGLWLKAGADFTSHQYEFSQIGFKSGKNQLNFNFGVSYAF